MEENIKESKIVEVDKLGGWIITHHKREWDTRLSIAKLEEQLEKAKARRNTATEEISAIESQIEEAKSI